MSVPVHSLRKNHLEDISTPDKAVRELTGAEAIQEALYLCMARDSRIILVGEGVPDPKAIFGTTAGLREIYGTERVHDMPLSENGMTGICIGAALTGLRPVMVHQRIDFALLAMDQIVNNAAKWRYMFAGVKSVPLVIRLIIGRGWGQGPQHSQSLQSIFAHIPGLKVVMPAMPEDAKGMLCAAIADNNPVIFIEHRWMHPIAGTINHEYYERSLDGAIIRHHGKDATIAAFSYMVIEALHAAKVLKEIGIELEVIDMRSVSPLDIDSVSNSVVKTGRLIVADTGHKSFGIAGELIASIIEESFLSLKKAPSRITSPDIPNPTSPAWAGVYYPDAYTIAWEVLKQCDVSLDRNKETVISQLRRQGPADVPNLQYKGPF